MHGARCQTRPGLYQVSERVCQREPLRDRALSPLSTSRERSRRDSRVSGLRTACGGGGWGGSCGGDRGVCARPVARPHDRRDPRVNLRLYRQRHATKPVTLSCTLSAPGRSRTGCVLFRSVAHAERADGSQQQRKRKIRPQHGPQGWGASIARASISSVAPSTAAASRWMPRCCNISRRDMKGFLEAASPSSGHGGKYLALFPLA